MESFLTNIRTLQHCKKAGCLVYETFISEAHHSPVCDSQRYNFYRKEEKFLGRDVFAKQVLLQTPM